MSRLWRVRGILHLRIRVMLDVAACEVFRHPHPTLHSLYVEITYLSHERFRKVLEVLSPYSGHHRFLKDVRINIGPLNQPHRATFEAEAERAGVLLVFGNLLS